MIPVPPQTFHDFCAHTGWKLACSWHQMQVFYNEKESPIPLETDPIMEVDTLHRACKRNYLPSYYFLLALSILMGGYSLAGIYFVPIDFLSSSSRMITRLAYLCLFSISMAELITYFIWYRKAKREAQNGIFADTPSTVKIQKLIVMILRLGVVWWFANLFAGDDPLLLWIAVVMSVGFFIIIFLVNGSEILPECKQMQYKKVHVFCQCVHSQHALSPLLYKQIPKQKNI